MREHTKIILVDMHAETTSEKIAMGNFLDGTVSAVFGTHTHVQTADERILPKGTGFICDAGMCGPEDSCLGRNYEPIIKRFLDNLPGHFPVASGPVLLCGAIVEVDERTGLATKIERGGRAQWFDQSFRPRLCGSDLLFFCGAYRTTRPAAGFPSTCGAKGSSRSARLAIASISAPPPKQAHTMYHLERDDFAESLGRFRFLRNDAL